MKKTLNLGIAVLMGMGIAGAANAAEGGLYHTEDGGYTVTPPEEWNQCTAYGPQSPRDVDAVEGINPTLFRKANNIDKMNLCNIHYHRNAEHKAEAYSTFVDTHDAHSGWACQEPDANREDHLLGHTGVAPGDTIEVHWVHTSCDLSEGVEEGAGLGACVTAACANPQLRVVAQIFTVDEHGEVVSMEEPMESHDDETVIYIGSTTGPTFNNDHCSPYQVTWEVKNTCATMDAEAFLHFSEHTPYGPETDGHAHGVRELVTPVELLSNVPHQGDRH